MTELLTAAQMRAIEQAAIASGEVTGLELMERAGRGVVEAVFEEWPELATTSHRAVVLCGPGNNGGDGFVVARLLKDWGWEVEVFLYGDADKLPPDARVNYKRWGEMGEVGVANHEVINERPAFDLRVDAVFGTGLQRPPSDVLSGAFQGARKVKREGGKPVPPKRVAVDCPSCLDLDTGRPRILPNRWEGDIHLDFYADLTVSFHRFKVGLHLAEGANYCRKLKVVDIGLEDNKSEPPWICRGFINEDMDLSRTTCLELSESSEVSDAWPEILLWKDDLHKFKHGHALILSGPSSKTGAARLAARGALRIGAGVVTVGCPPDAVAENAAQLNAIMLEAVQDAEALAWVLQDTRINALCLGPALGQARARELVPVALAAGRKCMLDADALSAYADDPETLFKLTSFHREVVLTPHAGEFARLFPDIAKRLSQEPMSGPAYSKVDATREAAKRAGCVVLFKGADTVIADPDGRAAINSALYERAAPWLATAGSGDVLAGFITGLLARGFAPMQAAEVGAWLHVECALKFGAGLIAEDLPETLPKVFSDLGV